MEIGADFRHNCRTSEDMTNRRLPLDSLRLIGLHTSRNDVLILVLQPFIIGLKKKTWELEPILAITAQPVKIRPIGGYQWIPRVKYDVLPPGTAFVRKFGAICDWTKKRGNRSRILILLHNQRSYGQSDVIIRFPASNMLLCPPEWRSNGGGRGLQIRISKFQHLKRF